MPHLPSTGLRVFWLSQAHRGAPFDQALLALGHLGVLAPVRAHLLGPLGEQGPGPGAGSELARYGGGLPAKAGMSGEVHGLALLLQLVAAPPGPAALAAALCALANVRMLMRLYACCQARGMLLNALHTHICTALPQLLMSPPILRHGTCVAVAQVIQGDAGCADTLVAYGGHRMLLQRAVALLVSRAPT